MLRLRDTARWLLARLGLAGVGLVVILHGLSHLLAGEPDYLNLYRQPVSSHVVVILGAAIVLVALVWPRSLLRSSAASRGAVGTKPRRAVEAATSSARRPGRNSKCPCGSGRKYKKCCLRRDEEKEREERIAQRSARLNRSNAVTGGGSMASRGLGGR